MQIIGIGGLPRSGKDSLAELFMGSGYFGVSLGDIVRDHARTRHADQPDPISVKNMTETSNYLRTTHGPDFALKEAFKRFEEASKSKEYKGLVVFSVRAPVEVDFIQANGGTVIWVDATDEVRHQRMITHMREGEAEVSIDEMKSQEALQEVPQPGKPPEIQMNTTYVHDHADIVLANNGDSIEAFESAAKTQFSDLL